MYRIVFVLGPWRFPGLVANTQRNKRWKIPLAVSREILLDLYFDHD